MKNGVTYKGGRTVDFNGLIVNGVGNTPYLNVVRGNQKNPAGETMYWVITNYNGNFQYGLYASTNILQAAWVATYVKTVRRPTADEMKATQSGFKAIRNNTLWATIAGIEVPESFEFDTAITHDDYSAFVKAPVGKGKVTKKVIKETNITEEFVASAVNTILGNKVDIKARIRIKDIVVANTEFYRDASDVTAYVNDLVKYKFA